MGQFRFHGKKAIVRENLWGFPEFVSWEEIWDFKEKKDLIPGQDLAWQKRVLGYRKINDAQGFCDECKTFLKIGGN